MCSSCPVSQTFILGCVLFPLIPNSTLDLCVRSCKGLEFSTAEMKNIRVLHYFSFLNGFRPHWPIAVIYFQGITSSYATAMTIYSIVFLSQAFLEVPAGIFSDGIGRRKTMIFGAVCASVYITCYAIGINFWILVLGALFEGLARALFSGTDSALLFESLPEESRTAKFQHYLGRVSSMSQLALCLSAALCSLLSN